MKTWKFSCLFVSLPLLLSLRVEAWSYNTVSAYQTSWPGPTPLQAPPLDQQQLATSNNNNQQPLAVSPAPASSSPLQLQQSSISSQSKPISPAAPGSVQNQIPGPGQQQPPFFPGVVPQPSFFQPFFFPIVSFPQVQFPFFNFPFPFGSPPPLPPPPPFPSVPTSPMMGGIENQPAFWPFPFASLFPTPSNINVDGTGNGIKNSAITMTMNQPGQSSYMEITSFQPGNEEERKKIEELFPSSGEQDSVVTHTHVPIISGKESEHKAQ